MCIFFNWKKDSLQLLKATKAHVEANLNPSHGSTARKGDPAVLLAVALEPGRKLASWQSPGHCRLSMSNGHPGKSLSIPTDRYSKKQVDIIIIYKESTMLASACWIQWIFNPSDKVYTEKGLWTVYSILTAPCLKVLKGNDQSIWQGHFLAISKVPQKGQQEPRMNQSWTGKLGWPRSWI